jgi:hypothetical protein
LIQQKTYFSDNFENRYNSVTLYNRDGTADISQIRVGKQAEVEQYTDSLFTLYSMPRIWSQEYFDRQCDTLSNFIFYNLPTNLSVVFVYNPFSDGSSIINNITDLHLMDRVLRNVFNYSFESPCPYDIVIRTSSENKMITTSDIELALMKTNILKNPPNAIHVLYSSQGCKEYAPKLRSFIEKTPKLKPNFFFMYRYITYPIMFILLSIGFILLYSKDKYLAHNIAEIVRRSSW